MTFQSLLSCLFLLTIPFLPAQIEAKLSASKKSSKSSEKINFVLDTKGGYGMFSCFTMVLGSLENYEKGVYKGVWINFGTEGLYYEPTHGPNWWEYYFKPIKLGKMKGTLHHSTWQEAHRMARIGAEKLSRKRAHALIQKYIQVDKAIQAEVDQIVKTQFANTYVIGIHYRGTDKVTSGEALETNYETVMAAIDQHIAEKNLTHFKLFIATDEEPFIDYISYRYPGKVCFQPAHRSSDELPVHLQAVEPYQVGREALIDTLLLSRTSYLIRTASNLSLCSTFFNPNLPVKLL